MKLPFRKGGSVRTAGSRQAMMPFDRRQFEYSRNSREFLYSGAREYEYKLMRKIKAKALFHNSKYHVVELLRFHHIHVLLCVTAQNKIPKEERDESFYHCSNYNCHVVRCGSVFVLASGKLH